MKPQFPSERVSRYFDAAVVGVLMLLLMIVIVLAVADLWLILANAVMDGRLAELKTVPELQLALQRSLAGVLLVLLGLEMMEALRSYFAEHRVKVEIILVLALIAVGRHVIQLDFQHVDGIAVIGIGVLVIALAAGLAMIRGVIPPNKSNSN
jgi:uncharacterized membrane protein (DUF373 family)